MCCTFLFWIVYCGISDRSIVGFVNLVYLFTLMKHDSGYIYISDTSWAMLSMCIKPAFQKRICTNAEESHYVYIIRYIPLVVSYPLVKSLWFMCNSDTDTCRPQMGPMNLAIRVIFRWVQNLGWQGTTVVVSAMATKWNVTCLTHPWQQGSWGQHGAQLGPTGPRCAPCLPHKLCYLWSFGESDE